MRANPANSKSIRSIFRSGNFGGYHQFKFIGSFDDGRAGFFFHRFQLHSMLRSIQTESIIRYRLLLLRLFIRMDAVYSHTHTQYTRTHRHTGKHIRQRFNISRISNYVCAVKHTIAGRDSFLFLVILVLCLLFLLVYVFRFSLKCIHSLCPNTANSNLPIFIGRQSQSIYIYIG